MEKIVAPPDEVINLVSTIPTVQKPPEIPKIPPIPLPADVPDDFIEVDIPPIDWGNNIPTDLPPNNEYKRKIEADEQEPFTFTEFMPEPIGGVNAIFQKIKYPPLAIKVEIEGTVIIEAVINKQGNVENAVVVRGIGGGCDEEALEAVTATKFIPGRQGINPVRVRMKIPIKFKLMN